MARPGESDALERATEILRRSTCAVALTGAGLSTESGIPDFRSPGGVWERFQPVQYEDFVRSEEARREHWRYKRETIPVMLAAKPNRAHEALARLESAGRLTAIITQNIDGLHQAAGNRTVVELHGTNRRVVCLECQAVEPIEPVLARLGDAGSVPLCLECGGPLKPATISFGQMLPPDVMRQALEFTRKADCLLVIGSSLQVRPAADLVDVASQHRASIVIATRSPTPYDHLADVKLDESLGECLPRLIGRVLDVG